MLTVPPIKIQFMLACYISGVPEAIVWDGGWNSIAGMETRKWLRDQELITNDNVATEKGIAWVMGILSTPLPVAEWRVPERAKNG